MIAVGIRNILPVNVREAIMKFCFFILKLFIKNRACPEGSMVQGYCKEEVIEWALNYTDPSNLIGVPNSHHEGRLTVKRTIGKKAITLDPNLFHCTHFHVLQ
jgi:hypothetical protein